jgi:hypothetical protein
MSYLTDLLNEESKVNTIILSTDYFTNNDKQKESDDNIENKEKSKGSYYIDNQISESNIQLFEKSTYYHSDTIEEFSSYSTNLIKDIPATDFKSEIIEQESTNLINEMTDSNKEQIISSNSEMIGRESQLTSEIEGKISDFNSQIPTEKAEKMFDSEKIEKSSNTIVEKIGTDSGNIEKSIDYNSNSFIDSYSNYNNIDKSTNIIDGITSNFFKSENNFTEKQETYLFDDYFDFLISPEKCLCEENLSYLY